MARTLTVGSLPSRMVSTDFARTPDGHRLEVAAEMDAPPERLWELLTHTSQWPEWGPLLSDAVCDVDEIATGVTGVLETTFGLSLPFRITSCLDHRWTWDLYGVTATGHRVEPLGDGGCRVVFEVPLVAMGYSPICAVALQELENLA